MKKYKRLTVILFSIISTIFLILGIVTNQNFLYIASMAGFLIAFLEEKTDLLMVRVISTTVLVVVLAFGLFLTYLELSTMYDSYKEKQKLKAQNERINQMSLPELETEAKRLVREQREKKIWEEPGIWDGYLFSTSYPDDYYHTGTYSSSNRCLIDADEKLSNTYKYDKCICIQKCQSNKCKTKVCDE